MIIIFTTTPTIDEAEKIARGIVETRLAACVQILPKMRSFYFWEGAVETDDEFLLLIKTIDENFEAVRDFIHSNHSYEIPEIIAVKASDVSHPYLQWMKGVVE